MVLPELVCLQLHSQATNTIQYLLTLQGELVLDHLLQSMVQLARYQQELQELSLLVLGFSL